MKTPRVSIGLPVYNGERYRAAREPNGQRKAVT